MQSYGPYTVDIQYLVLYYITLCDLVPIFRKQFIYSSHLTSMNINIAN